MGIVDLLQQAKDNNQAVEIKGEDALKELVGEGKKYSSVEELAKGALHGQVHIAQLEKEAAQHKDEQLKNKGVEELLAKINGKPDDNADGIPAADQAENNQDFGATQVESMIAKALQERDNADAAKQEAANRKSVVDALQKQFGNKALEKFEALSKEVGADLNELAGKSPSLVLALIQGNRPETPNSQLPPGGAQQPFKPDLSQGQLTKKKIQAMYAAGEIDRYEKIALENENLVKLGHDVFYS